MTKMMQSTEDDATSRGCLVFCVQLADTFLYHGEHVGDSIMSISRSTAKGLKEADQNIVNRLPENPVHIVWMLLAL